jgi:predicted nucleic acid-binding protein
VKWLLDTNVVSESIRPRPEPRVLSWIPSQPAEQMAISIVTLAELRDGTATVVDETRRRRLEHWIDTEVVASFAGRTLPLTVDILGHWLFLARKLSAKGRPRSAPDLLIAATARVHGLIIVSRNSQDFMGTDVVVFDPWTEATHRMDAS